MKQIVLPVFVLMTLNLFSQTKVAKLLNYNIGYGTENNWGNTGFIVGIGYQRETFKKIDVQVDVNYFTTGIYNAYLENGRRYEKEDRFYNNGILSAKLGYSVAGRIDKPNIRVKVGLSAMVYKYKILKTITRIFRPDGSIEVVPGSISYYRENGIRLAYNVGFDFNVPINKTSQVSIGLDTYSSLIPIEFFFPFLSYKRTLK
jgi:hypothetical protein